MAARNGRSSPLGSVGPLEMAARAGSIRLGLASKTPHLPRFATSSPVGSAGALEMAARARSAPLGRSKQPLEPARLHWGAQNGRSNSLGSAKALEITRSGYSKTLHLPTFPKSSPLGSAGEPPRVINYVGAFCAKIFTNAILFSGETLANRGNEAIQG